MWRLLWEPLLQLDATLAAALVAGVVSLLVTIVTILFTPIGSYLLAKQQLRDKLRTEYEYEQRKNLRNLIGRYHGRILQAAEELHYRMLAIYFSEEEGWLDVPHEYHKVGANPNYYFFQTTVHRFLALFAVVRQFEAEALYIDSRIADEKDYEFVKYARAIMWAAISPGLFSGLDYDESKSQDHFFKDDLRRACDYSWVKDGETERLMSLDELRGIMGKEPWIDSTLDFFRELHANEEDRYRWDRLVALHLILLAFIEDFGHTFQSQSDSIGQAVAQFDTLEVPHNLLVWLPRLGFLTDSDSDRSKLRYWPRKLRHGRDTGIRKVATAVRSGMSNEDQ